MDAQNRNLRRALRTAAVAASLALAAAACASGSSTQTASGGTAPQTSAPANVATTAVPKPCDTSLNPAGYFEDAELAGTINGHSGMSDGDMAGMDHSNMPGMDKSNPGTTAKPMDMSGGLGEIAAAKVMIDLAQMSDADYQKWLESLNPNRVAGAPDDTGMGGHLGPQTWSHISDPATCEKLKSELDQARLVAKKFPKAADAIAVGYVRIAPYLAGIASHWMKFDLVDRKFDVNTPEMLLFDGNDANANLVGLSYFIRSDGGVEPTEGFTGDNDHYHRHEGLCVGAAGVIGDSTTTEEECKAIGGRKQAGASGWMSHAWVVPGCESPWGVFSAQNPLLDMPLVDKSGDGQPCSGSKIKDRWNLTPASG